MRILMSVTSWDGMAMQARLAAQGEAVSAADTGCAIFDALTMLGRPVVIVETNLPDMKWDNAVRRLRAAYRNMSIFVLAPDSGGAT